MRCHTCGYQLIELVEHRCPECGSGFDPNDPFTFDSVESRLRMFRTCLWIAGACSAYALIFVAVMVAAAAVRVAGARAFLEIAEAVFSVSACASPGIVLAHATVLLLAPLVAGEQRGRLWKPWLAILLISAAAWSIAGAVFMLLLAVLTL